MSLRYLLICAVVCAFVTKGFSQQKEFVLQWNDNTSLQYSEEPVVKIHGFQSDNFVFNPNNKTVLFASNVAFPVQNDFFELVNVSYETIAASKLRGYNLSKVKSQLHINVKRTSARGKIAGYIEFNPIVKINGQYKKVVSLVLDFKLNNARQAPVAVTNSLPVTNSAMASGQWYKFYINKTGVHKLTRSFFSSLGINVANVNPQNIRLFGNGGKAIPLRNSNVMSFDVTENAVKFVGEADGSLDSNDYMLFYGVSSRGWDVENNTNINPYADRTYYYINVGTTTGKRIQPIVEPTVAPNEIITTFDQYQFYEKDEVNLVRLGRRWFGNAFDVNASQNFKFNFPKIDTSQPIRLKVLAAATAGNTTFMGVTLNGNPVDNFTFPAISSATLATEDSFQGFRAVNASELTVGLTYNNSGNPSANAFLDYISIEATSFLRSDGKQFDFKKNQVASLSGVGEYQISNASTVTEVWDVTDMFNVSSKTNTGAANTFSFKATLGELRNYVAVVEDDFYTPSLPESTTVSNSNLKGTIFLNEAGAVEDVDYIVVTPRVLKGQATRLANLNTQNLGLRTRVVTLEEIYAEFNTGNQDIGAIRNFVRYVYENGITNKLKYLCLFGDASFDVKNRIPNNTNYTPTFHTLPSFSLITSFMSDDYFGMMDLNEGTMGSADRLDIAVGRIIADGNQQAAEMVTKIQQYYEQESYGSWRNRMTILSDDVDDNWEFVIEEELDNLADDVVAERPFINMTKLHSDSFQQETSAGGELYPQVNETLLNNIQLGSLVVNYFGHGGEDGLAHERIFQKNDAQGLNNICRYNLFVTVTCEFTRFDNPYRVTAGEVTYWNPSGGAIGLITTTREIFVTLGISMNQEIAKYLFDFDNTGYVSIAEALRLSKNNINNTLKRVVFYVGDPALKLAIPEPNIKLTKINGIPITDPAVPDLQALGRVTLTGEVVDGADQVITNYNGLLSTTIYDKKQQRTTLGNDGVSNGSGLLLLDYETLGEIIFRGQASIENGVFEFDFVVPRDISIPLGDGRVSFYAKRENTLENQTGVNTTIKVGGINTAAPADDLPPKIQAFMNDESFVSGGTTNESPFLLLKLSDDNGINTASGIGHDITAILDGDESNPQILNDYYETEPNNFTQGKVKYQYKDLEPGLHTLKIKAWDVYNNSVATEIQFLVVNESDELVVERVLNYPNPFVDYTEFWFNHNSASELDVMVQVYTVTGKLVKTLKGNSSTDNKGGNSSLFRGLPWNGKDDFGDKIGKGVYVYKLTVKSSSTNKKTVKFEKLVIL